MIRFPEVAIACCVSVYLYLFIMHFKLSYGIIRDQAKQQPLRKRKHTCVESVATGTVSYQARFKPSPSSTGHSLRTLIFLPTISQIINRHLRIRGSSHNLSVLSHE